MAAIAEWAADAPQPIRAALGARRAAPDHWAAPAEATIRRTLARLDADALAGAIGAWLADRQRHERGDGAGRDQRQWPQRRAVAVDGKTVRGAHPPDGDGRPVHLLACMDHAIRAVLAQTQVGGAPEEVPAFQPLLAPLDLAGVVVTADALQTHPDAAEFSVRASYDDEPSASGFAISLVVLIGADYRAQRFESALLRVVATRCVLSAACRCRRPHSAASLVRAAHTRHQPRRRGHTTAVPAAVLLTGWSGYPATPTPGIGPTGPAARPPGPVLDGAPAAVAPARPAKRSPQTPVSPRDPTRPVWPD
jgi:hypothetical protein